ncbi:hypothetical protein GA0115249_118759 [Streptomyces sp. PpalLS-921]|nr:hypothetical protein GA0115249_118759 [Streptomyces sp. PpalLS-921]
MRGACQAGPGGGVFGRVLGWVVLRRPLRAGGGVIRAVRVAALAEVPVTVSVAVGAIEAARVNP